MCDVVRFNFQQQVESTTRKIVGTLVSATREHVISNLIFYVRIKTNILSKGSEMYYLQLE